MHLILASTSPYRAQLLSRFGLAFDAEAPGVDEAAFDFETPSLTARRLAAAKAAAVQARHPQAWVIGSDQVAELQGRFLGKPGSFDAAFAQLRACSGHSLRFHTAVCLSGPSFVREFMDETHVRFRTLSNAEIERYLRAEAPYDCAGSFKCEGLGISLFEAIDSHDPTALIGLPLIALAQALRKAGFDLP